MSNVAPGDYTLSMVAYPRDEDGRMFLIWNYMTNTGGSGAGTIPPTADFYNGKATYFVELPLTLEKNLTDLMIPALTGRQLCGQLEFTGAAEMPPQPRAQVQFVRPAQINSQLPVVPIGAD